MSKISKKIDEHYKNQDNLITTDALYKIVKEQLTPQAPPVKIEYDESGEVSYEDLFEEFEKNHLASFLETEPLEEKKAPLSSAKGEVMNIPLPKLVPTEAWGDPTSDAYKQLKPFVLRAAGASKSIEGRFEHLTRIFGKSETKIASPGRIISSLILLESFAAVLNSFSDSSAGFVFEGFLSALTFGKQVADKVEGSLPIEDIIAFDEDGPNGVPASLKLLKGRTERPHKRSPGKMVTDNPGTSIHGSFRNLVSYFDRYPAIDYIVALKTGKNNVEITSFQITRDNIIDVLSINSANDSILGWDTGSLRKAQGNWEELRPLLQQKARYSEKSQWAIKQNQFRDIDGFKSVATIDLSTENLAKLNQYWASQLNTIIINLFEGVESLSKNINSFFLSENRSVAKSRYGPGAIDNTKKIGKSMTGAMKDDDRER